MRYSMKRQEQLLLEYLRHQRTWGPGGQGAENRGPEERNGDNREGGAGQHVLEGKTGSLESGQGGEIETTPFLVPGTWTISLVNSEI